MSYELAGFRPADLVRLDILVAGEKVLPLSELVPRKKNHFLGRSRVERLKELLPRELFAVAIQAEVEGRIIARETIPALKKDVTGYLYGGDRTRKMKLWKKQQRGKKKLKEMGRVEISPEVFLKMMQK
jgi:GTP-binding protein LepA